MVGKLLVTRMGQPAADQSGLQPNKRNRLARLGRRHRESTVADGRSLHIKLINSLKEREGRSLIGHFAWSETEGKDGDEEGGRRWGRKARWRRAAGGRRGLTRRNKGYEGNYKVKAEGERFDRRSCGPVGQKAREGERQGEREPPATGLLTPQE